MLLPVIKYNHFLIYSFQKQNHFKIYVHINSATILRSFSQKG